jgi:hypothetical protein
MCAQSALDFSWMDEVVTEHGVVDRDGSLRPTVRALLSLAYDRADYDVTLLPATVEVAVRVRHTPFGPEAEVIDLAPPKREVATSVAALAPPPLSPEDAPAAPAPTAAPDVVRPVAPPQPTSPWWTPETPPR